MKVRNGLTSKILSSLHLSTVNFLHSDIDFEPFSPMESSLETRPKTREQRKKILIIVFIMNRN